MDKHLFVAGGVPGRYLVTRFVLWVPKVMFNARGEQMFLQNYLKPHTWFYLKERVEISPTTQQRSGTFKLTSSMRKPRHVFIWALNAAKLSQQTENMFRFNTFAISGSKAQFTSV